MMPKFELWRREDWKFDEPSRRKGQYPMIGSRRRSRCGGGGGADAAGKDCGMRALT